MNMHIRGILHTCCLLSAWLWLNACEDAEATCEEAQRTAFEAWDAYVKSIEKDYDKAVKSQSESKAKLTFEVEKRLAAIASKEATRVTGQKSGSTWHRAYQVAQETACRNDTQCSNLKRNVSESARIEKELESRLRAARKARDAARGNATKAQFEAEQVEQDFTYKLFKPAQDASQIAYQACKGVKP